MKLKITTLIIIEGNQVEDIYHSLEDNQDKAYQDLINQVNATYGDGGVLQFKNIKGIKNYFDSVTIETQLLHRLRCNLQQAPTYPKQIKK